MKKATVTLSSASPYSQSRRYDAEVPKLDKESSAAYDERCWREHQHYDKKTGEVFIPPMALKNALTGSAKYRGEKVQGKGAKTWTSYFTAGLLVTDPVMLGIHKDKTESEAVYCDPLGKKGGSGGSQVLRRFPVIQEWSAKATFIILDETITKDVFTKVLIEAGQFVGLGRFRPANNGLYGRFHVGDDMKWEDC